MARQECPRYGLDEAPKSCRVPILVWEAFDAQRRDWFARYGLRLLADSKDEETTVNWLAVMIYVVTLALGIGGFCWVRAIGERASETGVVSAATAEAAASVAAKPMAKKVDVTFHVLATLAAVICAGYAMGKLFRFFGQPPVIGEVVAGICLGPSLLGPSVPIGCICSFPTKRWIQMDR